MADESDPHWTWQFLATIGLLAAVFAMGGYLLWQADVPERVWQHRAYVFGSLLPIATAAVGWLIGREVHRGQPELRHLSYYAI